jgi:trimethylamine--corrinoid protein Co-methyltransferase
MRGKMGGLYDIGLKCVSEDEVDKIHAASIRILGNKGIVVHHDEVREIAKKKGAKVDDKVVYFPNTLVENAIETAPEYFEFQGRNKDKNIIIGQDLVLSPVHGVPFIIDENGRRPGTLADYRMLIKLSHQLDSLNLTGGIVIEPYDVDRNIRHVELMHHLFKLTDKPLLFVAVGEEKSKNIIEMTSIALGGKDNILKSPALILSVNPVSPLKWDNVCAGTILEFAKNRQALVLAPGIFMGITGPITPMGTCVLQNAEILSGITLAQMINEGTPVVYGAASGSSNMKSANIILGSPESILMNMAAMQMAKFYKVPSRIQATLTDAKSIDWQAGVEGAFSTLLLVLAHGEGAYLSQAVGQLDSYLASSAEKFVVDDEICGRLISILKGLDTSEESYALETIMGIGHEAGYLTDDHTFNHFKERWQPTVSDWDTYEDWDRKGNVDIVERARARVNQLLDSYIAPQLDQELEKDLRKYVRRFKESLKK